MKVGCKLRVSGAELLAEKPFEPLDAPAGRISLRVHYNGCALAPWDEPLGLRRAGTTFKSLNLVHPDGGAVPRTVVVVQRVYPALYWNKSAAGGEGTGSTVVLRTTKAQEAADKEWERRMQDVQEKVMAKVGRHGAAVLWMHVRILLPSILSSRNSIVHSKL